MTCKRPIYRAVQYIIIAVIILSAAYIGWWRCGEMFPEAQLACFIGSER